MTARYISAVLFSLCCVATHAETTPSLFFKDEMLALLVEEIPKIIKSQDPATGQWGTGIWIVQDQHAMFPLAVAYSYKHSANTYYHDPDVLAAIIKGGDALIADADKRGQWVFRKKDKSTWGKIWMPWTYSRWVRSYGMIRDAMPEEKRKAWDKALTLAYSGIAAEELKTLHNIPAHHAMGLSAAAKLFNRDDWAMQARDHIHRITKTQHADGYWSEHVGPVMGYNLVYCDAVGTYYSITGDRSVLPALEKAARFHANFTYPDGSNVETIDERQLYHSSISMAGAYFSHSPFGRGYIKRQWNEIKRTSTRLSAETAATFLIYGEDGPSEPAPPLKGDRHYVTGDGKAMVHAQGDWFICLSGYTAPQSTSRWIQDRQNLVSLFHIPSGRLVLGGGNTKMTPKWSTFTIGDINLLKHREGDSNPDFIAPAGLQHVPSDGKLNAGEIALDLEFGETHLQVDADFTDANHVRLTYQQVDSTTQPVAAHLPLIAALKKPWRTATGRHGVFEATTAPLNLTSVEIGDWFEHAGWRVTVPAGATIEWPVAHHDQYAKYGEVDAGKGAIIMTLPLGTAGARQAVTFSSAQK